MSKSIATAAMGRTVPFTASESASSRRRLPRTALLLGTALGCSIAVAGLAPAAWAANECGAVVNNAGTDTATCVAGNYPNGISYTETGTNDLSVILNGGVTVETSGPGQRGVNAIGASNYDVSVTTASGDVITSNYNGVYALTSGTGNASMVNGADVSAYGRGLLADAIGGGYVSLTNTGNVTVKDALYGTYAVGILAVGGNGYVNNSGAVSVNDTAGGNAYGILTTIGGNVTEFNSGDITVTSTGGAYGISNYSTTPAASLYLNNSGNISVTATGVGNAIGVDEHVTGNAVVINSGDITASAQSGEAAGALVTAGGDLSLTVGNVSVTSATGYAVGASASSSGGNVSLVGTGSIYASGNKAIGVTAYSETGSVTVNVGDVTANSSGIGSFTDQGVGVYARGSGDVAVTAGNVSVSGTFAYGIIAHSFTGDASVTATSVNTTGDYGFGIFETASTGNASVSVSSITTSGFDAGAVFVRADNGVTINTGSITTLGDDSRAIYANSYTGQTSVTSGDIYTLGNSSGGIFAVGNSVTVVAVDTITKGNYSYGVDADARTGNASVTTAYVHTSGTNADGVIAYGNTGSYVHNEGYVETSGVGSTGIDASSEYGPTNVVSHTVITTADNSDGIDAYAYNGDVSVTSDNAITHGNYSTAVNATTYIGNVTVNSGLAVTYGEHSTAVYAYTYNGNISVTSTTAITHGNYSAGIKAYAYNSGNVTVNSGTVKTYGNYAPGIFAIAYNGNVNVTSGTIVTHGYESYGIRAATYTGDVNVHSGSITTYGDYAAAIQAGAGAGNVTVTTTGNTITHGYEADAIQAVTAYSGNVTVNTGGITHADDGVGVHIHSAGYATVNNSGSLYGGRGGIVAYSYDGVTINNAHGATIRGGGGYAIGTYGGGYTTINNSGVIDGYVELGTANNVVNNTNTGVFNAYGDSSFGGGTSTFNNATLGVVNVAPFSTSATTVTWNGLSAFNNSGLVDLRNGHTGDIFNLVGTTFTGLNGTSTLGIDASLSASLSADELIIGTAAGQTTIVVNNVGGPPALNFVGVPVVHATISASGSDNFVLGTIHDGFVDYGLTFTQAAPNGPATWNLVGLPGQPAFEFLKVPAMADGFWRRTGDAWTAREQEVRDSMWGSEPATRGEGWEMWAQAQIGGERLGTNNQTFTIQGFTFTPNLRTDTDWRGFQMGADTLRGNFMWGITGGFLEQNTVFHFDRNSLDMTGWNFGGYAGWTSGHFFLNGLLKGDWYQLKSNMPTVPAYETFGGNTWGAKGEAGFRFGGHSLYLEPVADVQWTSTHLDDANFHTLGADFRWGNNEMARGSIGARLGGQWGSIMPYIGLYAVDEWDDNAKLTMVTGGGCPSACFSIEDQHPGSYGRADLGFTTTSWNGLSGFLKVEDEFGSHVDGFIGRLGVRWRW